VSYAVARGSWAAIELTLASEPSSQTLWSPGKPILDFIFESGMNRIGHESFKPAGFSCKLRSLRDEGPGHSVF
jgi:hypothetical protein